LSSGQCPTSTVYFIVQEKLVLFTPGFSRIFRKYKEERKAYLIHTPRQPHIQEIQRRKESLSYSHPASAAYSGNTKKKGKPILFTPGFSRVTWEEQRRRKPF
jgi:hypothetical protein